MLPTPRPLLLRYAKSARVWQLQLLAVGPGCEAVAAWQGDTNSFGTAGPLYALLARHRLQVNLAIALPAQCWRSVRQNQGPITFSKRCLMGGGLGCGGAELPVPRAMAPTEVV